eukprot:m.1409830 g.1409830  ORF g.1409830 m.1409830 type:complete len:323 (-) comp25022_c1_seq86:3390-4358(-)
MRTRSKHATMEAKVTAVFQRRTDLGDDTENHKKNPTTFGRIRVLPETGPLRVDRMGLSGSMEFHRTLRSKKFIPDEDDDERSVLVQTTANCEKIAAYAHENRRRLQQALGVLSAGSFGENLHVDGGPDFHAGNLCVGDEFEVVRGVHPDSTVVARFQITSPRRPCSNVDVKHTGTYTAHGIRAFTARTGYAGMFVRVLEPGTILEGDAMRLVARPHKEWTLLRVSQLLYGDHTAVMRYAMHPVRREEWQGSQDELEALADVPTLAVCEYKDELFQLLGRPPIGRYKMQSSAAEGTGGWRVGTVAAITAVGIGAVAYAALHYS